MFTSEERLNLNASKKVKGKKEVAIVLQVSFWKDIVYTLKAMGPLVKVLRLVDNEKNPLIGSIYHAMLEGKELITKNFNNNESKNRMIENDEKLLDGLYACIDKLFESVEVVDAIHGELAKYKMGVGHFGLKESVRQKSDVVVAGEW
ncbi:hypothetical protein KIW84_010161 [Lathyrus oleraceus]|uniref:Uncharacterized protein n=1 Tax=Pisum sativum TaxID=3888 RepID=A0A9D5BB55_PEA|nr:hypothetical protein KIW84_010161 [Pisum sativum]